MKIAVIGATGLVGSVMLKVLQERGFTNCDLIPAASTKSIGKTITYGERKISVVSVEEAICQKPDYAIFSAGGDASKKYAPLFASVGTTVIDNSSAWRLDSNVPLVIPEINIDVVKDTDRIIANPNCSTIQMVLAISRLHIAYGIKRIVVSTYQSITGTGIKAIKQLESEEQGIVCEKAYPYEIHRNLFPHGGDWLEDGYTTEEQKLVDETRKILQAPQIMVSATVVRVPVVGGHSESINIEFEKEYDLNKARQWIANTPGITIYDDPKNNIYPMPNMAEGKDDVFVGRIRRDPSQPKTINMWVVADNLRKGAATNAIEILEQLIKRR